MPAPRPTAAIMAALPLLAAAAALLWPAAEVAAQGQQPAPQRIGEFQSWTAASQAEGGQKVCYAFTRATRSEGVPNRAANTVLLVVTHRPKERDQVALQAGYAYPRGPEGGDAVQVLVGGRSVGFFTSGSSAFARDGKAAVAALRNGREAVARGPLPNGGGGRGQASDSFSLAGFSAAYDAISRECPAPARAPASAPPAQPPPARR
jgi:invasion protein IalB